LHRAATTLQPNVASRYHCNQQYSITAITGSTGSVLERYAYTAYGVPTIANASGTVLTASAYNNRYTYTGREWDNDIGQYHYRARMYDASLGRFCGRDPIDYEGSEWNLHEYCSSNSLASWDSFGLKGSGHHIVCWSLFNGIVGKSVSDVFDSDDARLFDPCWKDHNYGPAGGVKHSDYCKAIKEELKKFLNGKPLSSMTPNEAKAFLNKIKSMPPTSVIGKFNNGIKAQIKEALEELAKQAAGKASKSGLKQCCRKGVGFCVRKIPVCAIGFFCYDAYEGGVGHACNELAWPVSVLWKE
jgi:RHS repeat-associated protein